MRIETYLRRSRERHPEKTAIVDGARRIGYDELDRSSDRLAAWLADIGVARGDRIVVFAGNGWQTIVAFFAAWKIGAVLCPINPTTRTKRLSHVLEHCAPKVVIGEARKAPTLAEALATGPSAKQPRVVLIRPNPVLPDAAILADCLNTPPLPAMPELPDSDLATITYTSGSTGDPKGVMMGHDNLDAATASIVAYLDNRPDDVIVSALPLSFGYGLTQLLTVMRVGATLVLEKSFAYPAGVLERLREERATGFAVVPSMLALILRMDDPDPALFGTLRYITSAAAPLPAAHIRRLRDMLPAVQLCCMYGQTECTRATWLPPDQIDRRPTSVGIAIPGAAIAVVDEEGRDVPPGTVGELVVSGAHLMRGYWNDAAATALALRPDPATGETRLFTGDLFVIDDEGYATFVSRKDDIIKSGGHKVAPREVEAIICDLDGVAEALVIGVPDPVLGEAIEAVITRSSDTLTAEEVLRHCAGMLDEFMVPRAVEFHDALPRTGSGKLDRRQLAAERLARP